MLLQRRRFMLAGAAALMLAGAARAAAPERGRLAPDMARLLARQRLIVATAGFALPPFVMTQADGALEGYDIDLARAMGEALGVPVAFDHSARSLDEVIDKLAGGEADLALSRLGATLERAIRVRFSTPYLTLARALLVSRPRFAKGGDPLDAAKAADAVIGVIAGSDEAAAARRLLPEARLAPFLRWRPDLVDAVRRGEVVAAFGDELQVKRVLGARPQAPLELRALFLPETREAIAAALPWDSLQLLAWVDLFLATKTAPVTVEELLARYPAPEDQEPPPR